MKMSQYTEREIDRNIKIIERDIERAEKNKEDSLEVRKKTENELKALKKLMKHQEAHLTERNQKLQYWNVEKRKLTAMKFQKTSRRE